MTKLQTGLSAAAAAAVLAAAGMTPATAAPLPFSASAVVAPQSDVVQVDRRWRRGWHNGYRGYHHYGHGYDDDDWWFPAGAFVAGALIGGAIANSNYYGGYYGGVGYYPRYYGNDSYAPRYYQPAPVYYPPRSSYRAGYREGYRDGYYARGYRSDITCTERLDSAGKC